MEIDFLGLNSTKYANMEEKQSNNAFTDTANLGVETSLSLSTRPSLFCQKDIHNFSEKKKKIPWDKIVPSSSGSSSTLNILTEQPSFVIAPPPVFRPSTTGGSYNDLNDKSTDLRKMSEIPAETASLTMLYSGCPIVLNDTLTEKAEKSSMYIARKNTSVRLYDQARICTRNGHTPTVAMARKATLARFLEKRFHRMNQARTAHLMGKPLNATISSSVCDTTITRSNNKKTHNILTR